MRKKGNPLGLAEGIADWNYLIVSSDRYWNRGLNYLKIGVRWLKGVLYKNRDLLEPMPLFSQDIFPCFASLKGNRNTMMPSLSRGFRN